MGSFYCLLSLAGELTVAIEEGLRKSTREVLEHRRGTATHCEKIKYALYSQKAGYLEVDGSH